MDYSFFRRRVYKSLYSFMRKEGRIFGQKVVWPKEIRKLVREQWPDEQIGAYDDQHSDENDMTLKDFLSVNWPPCSCNE